MKRRRNVFIPIPQVEVVDIHHLILKRLKKLKRSRHWLAFRVHASTQSIMGYTKDSDDVRWHDLGTSRLGEILPLLGLRIVEDPDFDVEEIV